jgi:hypothetical protein
MQPHLRLVTDGDGPPHQVIQVDTISLVMLDGINRIFHNGRQMTDMNELRQAFCQLMPKEQLQIQHPEIAETFTFINSAQKTIVLQNDRVVDQYALLRELDRIIRAGQHLRQEQLDNILASTPRGML